MSRNVNPQPGVRNSLHAPYGVLTITVHQIQSFNKYSVNFYSHIMGGYMCIRKNAVFSLRLIALSLLICLTIIGCVKEYPPFDEYQVIGSVPMDSVGYGRIFLADERLYTLYDPFYNDRWHLLREYDIADPQNPLLLGIEELTPLLRTYYINYQDTLVFSHSYYSDLIIFNLSTRESHLLDLDFNVHDIAYAQHYLFVGGYNGFRVFDISGLPNYVEIFNDSVTHNGGFIALRDTILLEIYHYAGYRFKFWNVADPTQPQVIIEGEVLDPTQQIYGIGLTKQFVICFDYGSLYRYRYDLNDPLIYEDALFFDFSYHNRAVSDSLIYVADNEHIEVIRIDDLTAQQIGIGDSYNEGILSMEIRDERIYVLIRNKGIQVYEKREP